jgi:hypothetical protein
MLNQPFAKAEATFEHDTYLFKIMAMLWRMVFIFNMHQLQAVVARGGVLASHQVTKADVATAKTFAYWFYQWAVFECVQAHDDLFL